MLSCPLDEPEALLALHQSGQVTALRSHLAQWIEAESPEGLSTTRLYAMLLCQWGLADDALRLLETAVARGDGDALLFNDLGALYFERRSLCAAAIAFERALALDPGLGSAVENADCTHTLLATAEGFLQQARDARQQWSLAVAVRLADQAIALAADLTEAHTLRHGALIELGDYGLAEQLALSEHDARGFDVMADEIVAGTLKAECFPRHRRLLAGAGPAMPAAGKETDPLYALRLGLEAMADENYAVGVRWLSCWCSEAGPSARLVIAENERFALQIAPDSRAVPPRHAVLLELALRMADRRMAQGAAAAYLRVLRTHGRARDALRIEQFLVQESPETKAFLEATRFVDLPTLAECGPRACRQTFVIIGTCIAESVRYVLNLSPAFRARFRLRHFITNRAARSMAEFVIGDDLLHTSAVIAHVAPQWADWGNEQAYVDLLARIPRHVQRISFPYPSFQPLWPFHCRDARQGQALPEGLWRPHEERPYYPYGDSYVHGLMRTATDVEDVVRRYLRTDVAGEIDLDKLLESTLRVHREREAHTDIKVVDDIEATFRELKLFDSINHITNRMALRIANQILARLDIEPVPERCLQQASEILSPEVPIHPAVARHFNLRYINDDTRYAVDTHRRLTYAEFIADYVRFY